MNLARLLLALAVAFVFTGRMQAAAQHCARQANEAAATMAAAMTAAAEADGPSCHGHAKAAAGETDKPAKPSHHSAPAPCECVAFGKGVPAPLPALASTAAAAWDWGRPGEARIASLDLTPDGPPPKG